MQLGGGRLFRTDFCLQTASLKQTEAVADTRITHSEHAKNACTMLCCNSYESSAYIFQKQQTFLRLCAERQNSCFSDVGLTVLSPFGSGFFVRLPLSVSLCAWAAESAHQINTEKAIVFRLETAKQVTDNGNTWKCLNCGCKIRESNSSAS